MKTRIKMLGALAACLATTANVMGQEDAAGSYIYSTYFYCDVTRQDRADEIVEKLDKPIYDAAVDDGTITGWGWLVHHTGGKWRRAQYYMAPDIESLLSAQSTIGDQIEAKNKKMADESGAICNAHEDYIWRMLAGNEAGPRGSAGFSVYYVCDNREAQADALVKTIFAPIYDRLVTEGKLVSWGWSEHIVGGEYRRLATMTAKDMPSLMSARSAAVEALEDEDLGPAFDDICFSHADYIWDIKFEK